MSIKSLSQLAENALPFATVSFLIFDGSEKCRHHIAVFIREKLELVMAFTPQTFTRDAHKAKNLMEKPSSFNFTAKNTAHFTIL